MTEENKDQTLATTLTDEALTNWGERKEIDAIARRFRVMLPNGSRMSNDQAFAAAQYAKLTTVDPFTGGFHIIPDGGIFNGYKTLVAWAQNKELYTEKYFPMTSEEMELEGYTSDVVAAWKCYLIRKSQQPMLLAYLQAGQSLQDSLDLIASRGIGVVTKKDTTSKEGRAIQPPRTWTWERVAKKRALRSAIYLGYGQPTLKELAALGEQAKRDGWSTEEPADVVNRAARLSAQADEVRNQTLSADEHKARLKQNVEILRTTDADIIDNTDEEDFAKGVMKRIPFYKSAGEIWMTLMRLELSYDVDNEEMLFDALAVEASNQADAESAKA